MEKFGLLKRLDVQEQCSNKGEGVDEHVGCDRSKNDDDIPAVVEFGAGRGYLTQMLVDCYGIERVILVERKSYKLKVSSCSL